MGTHLTPRRRTAFDRLLACAALAAAAVISVRAPGAGDYPTDAGPALSAIAHGSIAGFFSHQPAMGGVSLYLRAPFVVMAAALHDSPLGLYRWGDFPCVLSVALVALWAARIAGRRGMGRVGQALIVAVCLLNPLINDALYWGHPEEVLTASLAVGSLLAACQRRLVLTAVLAGLAVASKQWALLVVCPTLLALERERIRAAALMLAVAAGSTLPMVIGNFAAFRHALSYISRAGSVTTFYNWLYPLTPTARVRIWGLFGDSRVLRGHSVLGVAGVASHPLIIALGVIVPLLIWRSRGRHLSDQAMLLSVAVVFLLRCALDPESTAYYHFPLLLTLVALDTTVGRKIPVAGLVGVAGAFTLLDRFPTYLGAQFGNVAYIAGSLTALALLVRELRSSTSVPSPRRPQSTRWLLAGARRPST